MKTTLISLLTATLLGFAAIMSGRPFDAADFIAIAVATGLVAWTLAQYNAAPAALTKGRPFHLPINAGNSQPSLPVKRRVA